jgi:hypothetical protein
MEPQKIVLLIFFSKNAKKLKNGIDFASNIDNAKRSLVKVMNLRSEKLSSLLYANESQLNDAKIILIESDIAINESNDDTSCSSSSTIRVKPLLMSKSKKLEINSSIKKKPRSNVQYKIFILNSFKKSQ